MIATLHRWSIRGKRLQRAVSIFLSPDILNRFHHGCFGIRNIPCCRDPFRNGWNSWCKLTTQQYNLDAWISSRQLTEIGYSVMCFCVGSAGESISQADCQPLTESRQLHRLLTDDFFRIRLVLSIIFLVGVHFLKLDYECAVSVYSQTLGRVEGASSPKGWRAV